MRNEIATTKADNNASVSSTALAAKENVAASASALREQNAAAATASKEKIEGLDKRIEKLEDRAYRGGSPIK